jgi:hypothetical protein
VREAGKKIRTADLKVIHHHSLDLVSNPDTWIDAHIRIAEKWEGRMPGVGYEGGDWKSRARRAEAMAAVSRAQAVAAQMKAEAMAAQLQRDFDETVQSLSWKITEPLRKANLVRRTLKEKRAVAARDGRTLSERMAAESRNGRG